MRKDNLLIDWYHQLGISLRFTQLYLDQLLLHLEHLFDVIIRSITAGAFEEIPTRHQTSLGHAVVLLDPKDFLVLREKLGRIGAREGLYILVRLCRNPG